MPASSIPENSPEAKKRGTARFIFPTTEYIKKTVERAAALTGQDMSAFGIDALYQRAIATIKAHEVTQLKPEDHQAFLHALDVPPAPTENLRAAFAQHEERLERASSEGNHH